MGKDCRVVRFPGWQHSSIDIALKDSKQFLAIPVFIDNAGDDSHLSMIVVNIREKTIYYLDSAGAKGAVFFHHPALLDLTEALKSVFPDFRFIPAVEECHQGGNPSIKLIEQAGEDGKCGIYAVRWVKELALGTTITDLVSNLDYQIIDEYRFFLELANKHLTPIHFDYDFVELLRKNCNEKSLELLSDQELAAEYIMNFKKFYDLYHNRRRSRVSDTRVWAKNVNSIISSDSFYAEMLNDIDQAEQGFEQDRLNTDYDIKQGHASSNIKYFLSKEFKQNVAK